MNLIRLLLIAAVIYLAYRLVRRLMFPSASHQRPARQIQTVRCARCGIHIPAGEAVRAGPHHYCCTEHRDAGPG